MSVRPPILVVGRSGQVAAELRRRTEEAGVPAVFLGRPRLDIADANAVAAAIGTVAPRLVINASAYTAVDAAETDREAAFAVNGDGPSHLAAACARAGIPLIHLSTDYVFDGTRPAPYREDDPIAPLGVYAESKAAGEAAVRRLLERHVIVRTAWIFSATGGNFVKTMLRLGRERPEVRVVADQQGGPTWAGDVAAMLLAVAGRIDAGAGRWGTYHYCGQPAVSWHGFAAQIFAEAELCGQPAPTLVPITTAEYPVAARRPANSVLDCTRMLHDYGLAQPDWRVGLRGVVCDLLGQHHS